MHTVSSSAAQQMVNLTKEQPLKQVSELHARNTLMTRLSRENGCVEESKWPFFLFHPLNSPLPNIYIHESVYGFVVTSLSLSLSLPSAFLFFLSCPKNFLVTFFLSDYRW